VEIIEEVRERVRTFKGWTERDNLQAADNSSTAQRGIMTIGIGYEADRLRSVRSRFFFSMSRMYTYSCRSLYRDVATLRHMYTELTFADRRGKLSRVG
jgi:hypothetical protein